MIFESASGIITDNYVLARERSQQSGIDTELVKHDHKQKSKHVAMRLVTVEHNATSMPCEKRRNGVSLSKLQISFPLTKALLPDLGNMQLFNFLPVRAYGLPFLLNADFLLSANREDVLHNNAWNVKLTHAAIELFVKSVHVFNATVALEPLRYTWPRFTRSQGNASGTALSDLMSQNVKRVRTEDVLESQAGSFEVPTELKYVPLEFTDGALPPLPLLGDRSQSNAFLNTAYNYQDVKHLGVSEVQRSDFVKGLKDYAAKNSKEFRDRPSIWHTKVAQAVGSKAFAGQLHDATIIPLRDGTWTRSSQGSFYFQEIDDGTMVPEGLQVRIIKPDTGSDPSRRTLFEWLGAKNLDQREVCNLLMQQHKDHGIQLGYWTKAMVVSHARYVYRASSRYRLDGLDEMLLVTRGTTKLYKGSSLYMELATDPHNVTKYVDKDLPMVQLIAEEYLAEDPSISHQGWLQWLQAVMKVSSIPRLAMDSQTALTSEFQEIIKTCSSETILTLLRDHWGTYSKHINGPYSSVIRNQIAATMVDCEGGERHRLGSTYLPIDPLTRIPFAKDHIDFLKIPKPGDERWQRFHVLGVACAPDLKFYLTILKGLSVASSETLKVSDVAALYERIGALFDRDAAQAKKAFAQLNLVYLEEPAPGRWVALRTCVWSAPPCLQRVTPLSQTYPKLQNLFCRSLELGNTKISHVIQELLDFEGDTENIAMIKNLLRALNKYIRSDADPKILARLRKASILPVQKNGGLMRLANGSASDWLIADTDRLRSSFADKVFLLDFSIEEVKLLRPLLDNLAISDRLLSAKLAETTIPKGDLILQESTTYVLRLKGQYIARLAKAGRNKSTLEDIERMDVLASTSLTLRRSVQLTDLDSVHADDVGRVRIQRNSEHFRMYLNAEDVVDGKLPYCHMAEELCTSFDIPASRHHLVQGILTTDIKHIEDTLERYGFHPPCETVLSESSDDYDYTVSPLGATQEEQAPTGAFLQLSAKGTAGRALPKANSSDQAPSVSKRVRSREHPTPQRPKNYFINTKQLAAAAGTFACNDVVSVAVDRINGRPPSSIRNSIPPMRLRNSSSSTPSDVFDMRSMASITPLGNGSSSSRRCLGVSQSQEPPASQGGDFEKEIGFGGEHFIYEVLRKEFGIDEGCWTSASRFRAGLPAFEEDEADYADFTIKDPVSTEKVSAWLTRIGHNLASVGSSGDVTYHFEVKTTTGGCKDPFTMSNNQVELAAQWHHSQSDVYIILRVFDLLHEPKWMAYVDPHALHQAGVLEFAGKDGYYVQAV